MAGLVAGSAARAAAAEMLLPPIEETTLDNGLSLMVVPRGKVPLVGVRLVIRAGSAADPAGKDGLADFTARMLRRGTRKLSADAVDDAIELYGGSLGMETTPDQMVFALSTPSEHLPKMLDILGQLVTEPSFPAPEVEQMKKRVVGQIENEIDNPEALIDRAMPQVVYGDHPYGHPVNGRLRTVQSFTTKDVSAFHQREMGPRISLLAVVGLVSPTEVKRLVTHAFGDWKGGPAVPRDPPPPAPPAPGKLVVMDKPDLSQTQLRLVTAGVPKGHPEIFAIRIIEAALSSGFTSRLMDDIRVNRGLTYDISAEFERLHSGGIFVVHTYTRTDTTREMIDAIISNVTDLQKSGIKRPELNRVLAYLGGQFPARMETHDAFAAALAEVKLYGYATDYLSHYISNLHAVTIKQAQTVAQQRLFTTAPLILMVGNAKGLADEIKGLGKMTTLSIADVK